MMANALIDTSVNNSDILIWTSYVDFDVSSKIDSGIANIKISERCNWDQSVGIGGFNESINHRMAISQEELSILYCHNVTFDSLWGSMEISGISHYDHMSGVTGSVFMTVSRPTTNMFFTGEDSTFRRLYVNSHGGIVVDKHINVTTMNGTLEMFWTTDNLKMERDAALIANEGDLSLSSDASDIIVDFPATFQSTENIHLPVNMIMNRQSSENETILIWAQKTLTCMGSMNFVGGTNAFWNQLSLVAGSKMSSRSVFSKKLGCSKNS